MYVCVCECVVCGVCVWCVGVYWKYNFSENSVNKGTFLNNNNVFFKNVYIIILYIINYIIL